MQTINIRREGNSTFIMAFVPFGSYYEISKDRGIAHFIEHMLFKGTTHRTRKEIDYSIERHGGDLNAFTDHEITTYHCTVANIYKKESINIIEDMVHNPLFPIEQVEKERQVILQELKMYKDRPNDVLAELSNQIFYPKSNGFNCPIIGTENTLAQITRKDLVETFKREYKEPIMIVIGDVPNTSKYQFDRPKFKTTHTESCFKKRAEYIIRRPHLEQARVIISNEIQTINYTPLERFFLQNLVGAVYNDMSGRLFETIREKNHLVYGISFNSTQRSSDMIEWSVNLGLDADKIKKARKLIEQELVRPCSEDELKYALDKTIGTFALSYDDNRSIGEGVVYSIREGLNWHEIYTNYESHLRRLTPEVNRFIKAMRFDENILVGLVPK